MAFGDKKPGPGRPVGSRDFRPNVHKILDEYFHVKSSVKAVVQRLYDAYGDLSPRDKVWMDLELMKLGIQASPKDINQSNQMVVTFTVKGLKPKVVGLRPIEVKTIRDGNNDDEGQY